MLFHDSHSAHYRSPLNYSGEILMQAKAALEQSGNDVAAALELLEG